MAVYTNTTIHTLNGPFLFFSFLVSVPVFTKYGKKEGSLIRSGFFNSDWVFPLIDFRFFVGGASTCCVMFFFGFDLLPILSE